ncbi:MAG: hypothetical protein HKN04_15155 [Rhodothermaceae bacterium]|nr:hypothetical protein [Rhodothermaceae bacterium]
MSTSTLTLVRAPAATAVRISPVGRLRAYLYRTRRRFLFAPADFDFSDLGTDGTNWLAQLTARNG